MKTKKKRLPDFLDDIVEVRSRKNPGFPDMVDSALKKRRSVRAPYGDGGTAHPVPALRASRSLDRWAPIRRGKIYCSPGCGGGCTMAEYDQAVDDGEKLVRKLVGRGWHAVIHENGGWHYRAVSGPISVHPAGSEGFWCLMSSDPDDGSSGSPLWDSKGKDGQPLYFKDPNDAVADILQSASKVISDLYHVVIVGRASAGMSIHVADVLHQTPKQRDRIARLLAMACRA